MRFIFTTMSVCFSVRCLASKRNKVRPVPAGECGIHSGLGSYLNQGIFHSCVCMDSGHFSRALAVNTIPALCCIEARTRSRQGVSGLLHT
jgi:hypothetical protein